MTDRDIDLCQCIAILRNNFKGLDEVLAKKEGAEFMKRMKRIEIAADLAQQIWAEME